MIYHLLTKSSQIINRNMEEVRNENVNLPIRGRGKIFSDLILYNYIATTRNLEMQKRPINCMGEKRIHSKFD